MNGKTVTSSPPPAYSANEVMTDMKCCCNIGCKAAGLSALTFCAGMAAGLLLPIGIVAVLEAAVLILLGYLCLFQW